MAQLCLWTKIRNKQSLVLDASAFQCMRAGLNTNVSVLEKNTLDGGPNTTTATHLMHAKCIEAKLHFQIESIESMEML